MPENALFITTGKCEKKEVGNRENNAKICREQKHSPLGLIATYFVHRPVIQGFTFY